MYNLDIQSKIEMLPESAKQQVSDFVEFLLSKYGKVLKKRSGKGKSSLSLSKIAKISKTDAQEVDREITPYQKARHLIGTAESGISDLGQNHREHLRKKFGKNL